MTSRTHETCRTADGLELCVHVWEPPEPRAQVLLIHGYADHCGRYAHVAEALVARGLAVVGVDLRGHGRSPGPRGHVERFDDYHNDALALVEHARARRPDTPAALLAHSMGGLLALDLMRVGGLTGLGSVALSSPFLGLDPTPSAPLRAFARIADRFYPRLRLPSKLRGERVCGDPQLRRAYDDDALGFRHVTVRWALEALRAIQRVQAHDYSAHGSLLIQAAGDDDVVDVRATRRFAQRSNLGARYIELEGYRHEIMNEPFGRRGGVIDCFADWLERDADPVRWGW